MLELSGSLDGSGLVHMLAFLAGLKKSSRVRASHGPWVSDVFVRPGQVVAAFFGVPHGLGRPPATGLQGVAALEAMVLMPTGGFFVTEDVAPPEPNIALALLDLQAHLCAIRDRYAGRATAPLSLEAVPSRVDPRQQPSPDDEFLIDRGKLNLLLAIDGQRRVAELVGEHGLLRTYADLRWLEDHGLIQLSTPPHVAADTSASTRDGNRW